MYVNKIYEIEQRETKKKRETTADVDADADNTRNTTHTCMHARTHITMVEVKTGKSTVTYCPEPSKRQGPRLR